MNKKWGTVRKIYYFQNIYFIMLNNFNYAQLSLKNKIKGLERQWVSKITSMNDIICKKPDTIWKIPFVQNIPEEGTSWVPKIREQNGGRQEQSTRRWAEYWICLIRNFDYKWGDIWLNLKMMEKYTYLWHIII